MIGERGQRGPRRRRRFSEQEIKAHNKERDQGGEGLVVGEYEGDKGEIKAARAGRK